MLAHREQHLPASAAAALKEEPEDSASHLDLDMHKLTTSIRKNKKRFTDQQIKSLEVMFESDSRPESLTKQQLAGELGLQPRQVAIWFQNKRARSRAKQIERDYCILKATYQNLASSFESLKAENRTLLTQVKRLKSQQGDHQRIGNSGLNETENEDDVKFESKETVSASNNEQSRQYGSRIHEAQFNPSDDMSRNNGENLVEKEADILSVDLCSFESDCFVDESSCSQWWEFWS
ncbi:homeobox-leucine zipper protein ATHB-12 [Ziziphus jujuba]|uniref:Homeobox-leucine zipper protein n=2 Tax=Ziziphus jujuba TaxID=326968 RepID=A0A6P4AK55_ZIZJJ|nr:homeobox-leucine zipper protein ATHB-12 [Ziziphus jujuba]KAH7513656.1 hypothetical protein FEM48_Zijuj11G0004200 [Ziziphus jujuba var. spinosa]